MNKIAIIISLIVAMTVWLGGCTTISSPPPATTPTLEPEPTPTPAPPLNVTVNYIGIISAHDQQDIWDPDGEVQLVILITDGQVTSEPLLPPTKQGFKMGDFETKEINQRVFHTSSAGDYLKISIIAYDIDSKTETLDLLSMLEVLGAPGASELKKIYSLLPEEDDFIGYCERIWYPEENWGIGQYNAEGIDDFRVWFSVWADTEPAPISKPHLLPDVKIQSVSIPSQVKLWSWVSHTLTLANNEEHDITISWEAHSSVTGNFDGGSAAVRRNGLDIKKQYLYDKTGLVEITYTISYKGTKLDSWSGTLKVIP